MKVRDLIRNAIVLHSGGQTEPSKKLPALLREVQFKNLSAIGAYLVAQIDNEADPVVQQLRRAGSTQASGKSALLDSIVRMSSFNKLLNVRYGVPNSIILNVDDPTMADVVASLPRGIIKYQAHQAPVMPHIKSLLSREVTLPSYLGSLGNFLRERHAYNKAVSETYVSQEAGNGFGAFAKMTFLRNERLSSFPHATVIRPQTGISVSLLNFSADSYDSPNHWHGKELVKTYLFAHELGHCVMGDETHQMHFEKFRAGGDEVYREWMNEVYADVYSALFVARLTRNWDFLPLYLLPERATEDPDHNTFHCLRKLPHLLKANELSGLDERDLPRVAHNLMEQFLSTDADPEALEIQNCASGLYRWSKNNWDGETADFEIEFNRLVHGSGDSNFRLAIINAHAQRAQADIDSLGNKMEFGMAEDAIRRSILEIAGGLRLAGHLRSSEHLVEIASLPKDDIPTAFRGLMTKGAIKAGQRYEETAICIQNFWSEWRKEEQSYQPETKNPACDGRAFG